MTRLPAAECRVVYARKEDLKVDGRIVRTKVTHPSLTENLLIPVKEFMGVIEGYLEEDCSDECEDDGAWKILGPSQPWESGKSPVSCDGRLVFLNPQELELLREEKALTALGDILSNTSYSLFGLVSRIEHLDGLLGGHPATLAVLLTLSNQYPEAPELGDRKRLKDRFDNTIKRRKR